MRLGMMNDENYDYRFSRICFCIIFVLILGKIGDLSIRTTTVSFFLLIILRGPRRVPSEDNKIGSLSILFKPLILGVIAVILPAELIAGLSSSGSLCIRWSPFNRVLGCPDRSVNDILVLSNDFFEILEKFCDAFENRLRNPEPINPYTIGFKQA